MMRLQTRLNRDRPQSTSRGGFDRDQDFIQFAVFPSVQYWILTLIIWACLRRLRSRARRLC